MSYPTRRSLAAFGGLATLMGLGTILPTADAGSRIEASQAPNIRAFQLPKALSNDQAIACLTVEMCAVSGVANSTGGPAIAFTSTGGQSWSIDSTLPGPKEEQFYTVFCSSNTNCVAAGVTNAPEDAVAIYTTNGGRTWARGALPSSVIPGNAILSIYCSSRSHCLAGGRYISRVLVSL